MYINQIFAIIYEENIQNIIVCDNYEMANQIARAVHGDEGFAVECTQYSCAIGDSYIDNTFYKVDPESGEKTIIEYVPTADEHVKIIADDLDQTNEQLTETQLALSENYEETIAAEDALTETQLALTEQYEQNIALEDALTETQLALTELYESLSI